MLFFVIFYNMMQYFNTFKKFAFRLELLQEYDVKEETESFAKFMSTGIPTNFPEWEDIIKKANDRGAQMSRVHVLTFPLSDYLKYELSCYKNNENAGEKILLINGSHYNELGLNKITDFWIFDDNIVLKMRYSKEGKFLGFETITTDIDDYIQTKNLLLKNATEMRLFKFE